MAGGDEGMSPAELRALPVVIYEQSERSRRQPEGLAPLHKGRKGWEGGGNKVWNSEQIW